MTIEWTNSTQTTQTIIPSYSFAFASIILSFFNSLPTQFSFLLKLFYFTFFLLLFDHYQFELTSRYYEGAP